MKKDETPKTILLTRPEEEAAETAFLLKKTGFNVLFLPLFAPLPRSPLLPVDRKNTQAIVATSGRAVHFFSKITPHRATPLYAVGDRTAWIAQNLGFETVVSAKGTVQDLTFLILAGCSPEKGQILYISGALTHNDLPALLEKKGFRVRHDILYHMEPLVTTLPSFLVSSFKEEKIWGTLFFSPFTASSFLRLMRQAGLGENCAIGYLFCLSQAVADRLKGGGGKIKIAKNPNQASLLEIIHDTIHTP